MTEYNPNCWVVLQMTHKDGVIYKVLGGWDGSYLNGDSWRLNSGIVKAEYDIGNDLWKFYGSSGSVYNCSPITYGLRMSIYHIYQTMVSTYPNKIKLMEHQNWENMDWTK
jgi:hypothetical protein